MEIWSATVDAFALLASGDAALWRIVWVSLKVAIAGLLLAAPPGLLIAYLIAMHRFAGRRALVVLAQMRMQMQMPLVALAKVQVLVKPRCNDVLICRKGTDFQ